MGVREDDKKENVYNRWNGKVWKQSELLWWRRIESMGCNFRAGKELSGQESSRRSLLQDWEAASGEPREQTISRRVEFRMDGSLEDVEGAEGDVVAVFKERIKLHFVSGLFKTQKINIPDLAQ
ncbi:hypothetical protein PM082_004560 [Marasmius tenuissimus]|nr:hypothetical protein PM082_004560 [Marasmius tenuissimus]